MLISYQPVDGVVRKKDSFYPEEVIFNFVEDTKSWFWLNWKLTPNLIFLSLFTKGEFGGSGMVGKNFKKIEGALEKQGKKFGGLEVDERMSWI